LWGQVPFLVSVALLVALVAAARRSELTEPGFLAALATTAVASLLCIAVPWDDFRLNWIVVVPILDLVAVAFFRDTVYSFLPSATVLIVFPVLWLGYQFSVRAIWLAVVGAFLVTVFPFIRRNAWPSGPEEWADVLFLPILVSLAVISVFIGARELRRHQVELRDANRVLRQTVKAAQDEAVITTAVSEAVNAGIIFFDANHSVRLKNRAMAEHFDLAEYDSHAHAGHAVFEQDRQTPIPSHDQNVYRVQHGQPVDERVYWIGRSGNQRALISSSSRAHGADGEYLGTVLVGYDVTDLANAVTVREEFLASVSHELRTPLTSILGYLELVRDADEEGELGISAELAIIQRNAEQLLAVIGDLLAATPSDLHLEIARVDLQQLVREGALAARPRAKESALRLDYAESEPIPVDADGRRLRQVIDNILSNAVKYTPEGGTIAVSARTEGSVAVIEIADDGVGITPEDQRQLFDRFFRTKSARKNAVQGNGLGLSIVKAIVDSHHGSISVISELGKGSTFRIEIPAVSAVDS
jgi:signal transduction histidine kinase